MKYPQVFINGIGIVSPLGIGINPTIQALKTNHSAIRPLSLFPLLNGTPLPVGQVDFPDTRLKKLPRTHRMAYQAAEEAMQRHERPLDAIIVGTATGGMLLSEHLLRKNEADKIRYQYHGLGTIAQHLAHTWNCNGPTLTVSTACSTGAVAITMALRMLRSGQAQTILVGGAESLCRLTYYGFHSLQLVDPETCKPLDKKRNGMAVGEGAGMLLLSTKKTKSTVAELLGASLTCDAYHPAAPHPEGNGAYAAMQRAIKDADLTPEEIDYINLHGTGTTDNDQAESKAVRRLFKTLPLHSSTKGATGHTLSAAGAIEAVLSVIAIKENLAPANTNLRQVDPELGLNPIIKPEKANVRAVLSNSFGFGGNNGSLVITAPNAFPRKTPCAEKSDQKLAIHSYACVSGAGLTEATLTRLSNGKSISGAADLAVIADDLPPRVVRRLQRLPQMTLAMAKQALKKYKNETVHPDCVFMGTGWGGLTETDNFLRKLAETDEQFPSPTDFVGSVHNAPAGQTAIMFHATGPNVTTSGGDFSFEQAVHAAVSMIPTGETALVMGADEGHHIASNLLDPSIIAGAPLTEGGAAFFLSKERKDAHSFLSIPYYQACVHDHCIRELIAALEQSSSGHLETYGLIMTGIPRAERKKGKEQLHEILNTPGLAKVPVLDYRKFIGEFASASALATALGIYFLENGQVPLFLTDGQETRLDTRQSKVLILGLGQEITAMELSRF